MALDETIDLVGRLVRKRIRAGNQQDVEGLLPTFLGRGADVIRDGGVNAHCGFCGTLLESTGAGFINVDHFHRDGAGFDRRGKEGKVLDVFIRQHTEDVNGGKIEKLDSVDEKNSDADGFGSHFVNG